MDYILHQSFSLRSGKRVTTTHLMHGYSCKACGCGYSFPIGKAIRADVQAIIDAGICPTPNCKTPIAYGCWSWQGGHRLCCITGCNEDGVARTSLGIYAGHYCDHHYNTSFPLRKDGPEGYDYLDAGEHYADDY